MVDLVKQIELRNQTKNYCSVAETWGKISRNSEKCLREFGKLIGIVDPPIYWDW